MHGTNRPLPDRAPPAHSLSSSTRPLDQVEQPGDHEQAETPQDADERISDDTGSRSTHSSSVLFLDWPRNELELDQFIDCVLVAAFNWRPLGELGEE